MEEDLRKWNENRIRLQKLRAEVLALQEKQERYHKRLLQYFQERPNTVIRIDQMRLQLAETNVYPSLSQKFLLQALKSTRDPKDAEEIWKAVLTYRQKHIQKVSEVKILSK